MVHKRRARGKKIVLLFVSTFVASCAAGEFAGEQWTDFTAYYNLFFNITTIFEEAEGEARTTQPDPFNPYPKGIESGTSQKFNAVIEKCSDLLQFHQESSYVDDALLIVGKSYYYQNNFPKAERKFRELLATQEKSELRLETRLWIAKTLMQLGDADRSIELLEGVREDATEDDEELLTETYVQEAKLYIRLKDYETAVDRCLRAFEYAEDETVKAYATYRVGELYRELERFDEAAEAYRRVLDFSPPYQLDLDANISYARMKRRVGDYEEARETLTFLDEELKYEEARDLVGVELGRTLREMGRYDEAYQTLYEADTTFTRSKIRGDIKYEIGELFEKEFQNYDSAYAYYNGALRATAGEDYVYLIREKQRLFKNYFELRETFDERDRELRYLNDSTTFLQDSLQWAQDSALYAAKREQEEAFGDDGGGQNRRSPDGRDQGRFDQTEGEMDEGPGPKPQMPTMEKDTIVTLKVRAAYELGNLFFTELDIPDSARHYYRIILDDYPGTQYQASTMYALGSYYLTMDREDEADSLFEYIYENFPDERIVNAAATKIGKPLVDFDYDPAEDLFVEGENSYLNERYDSALATFFETFRLYPESDYAAKSLYTAGWILEEKLALNDSAAAVYDTLLLRYKHSDYSLAVMEKLDAYKRDREEKEKRIQDSLQAIQDSLQAIEDSVRAADSLLNLGNDSLAVADSLVVSDSLAVTDSTMIPDTLDGATEADSIKLKEIPVFEEDETAPKLKLPDEIERDMKPKRKDGDGNRPTATIERPPALTERRRLCSTG